LCSEARDWKPESKGARMGRATGWPRRRFDIAFQFLLLRAYGKRRLHL
jgi:hypothetical protein